MVDDHVVKEMILKGLFLHHYWKQRQFTLNFMSHLSHYINLSSIKHYIPHMQFSSRIMCWTLKDDLLNFFWNIELLVHILSDQKAFNLLIFTISNPNIKGKKTLKRNYPGKLDTFTEACIKISSQMLSCAIPNIPFTYMIYML